MIGLLEPRLGILSNLNIPQIILDKSSEDTGMVETERYVRVWIATVISSKKTLMTTHV